MNCKSLLLASAAVLFSGSAMAADLTNPFFQPGEGNFLSTTKLETSRTKMKHHNGAWTAIIFRKILNTASTTIGASMVLLPMFLIPKVYTTTATTLFIL